MCKFAVLPYCNAAPLVHFISEFCPSAGIVKKFPPEMLDELKSNRVDAALIPIADFLVNENLRMVPGIGICADGPVESVLLQSQKPLEKIRSIRLFPESRTSNILIQILISQYFSIDHSICFTTDTMATDASIIIGDKALRSVKANYTNDLSDMWSRQTGLPFVFAVWAYKAGYSHHDKIKSILYNAKQKGLDSISILSRIHAERLNLDPSYIRHYMTNCLYYNVGPREIESMVKFRELMTDINNNDFDVPVLSLPRNKKGNDEDIRQLYFRNGCPTR
jgi:chorismate dehydratase